MILHSAPGAILLGLQLWRTVAGWLLLVDVALVFLVRLPPSVATPAGIVLLVAHFVLLSRQERRQGRVRRKRTMGVVSLLVLGIAGLFLAIFRKRTPAPPSAPVEEKKEFSFRSEAGRWLGHTRTVVFATVPSGCLHLLLGLGVAAALCGIVAAFGILSAQRDRIGWGAWGIVAYLVVVLAAGGLVWGILTGIAHGIRRVIYEGGEVERLTAPVRTWLRTHIEPGAAMTQTQVNRLLDRLAGDAYGEEKAATTGKIRGWVAGKLKAIVVDRLGCGLIDEASDVDAAGNLRIDPRRLETAGLEQVKHHASRLATSFVDTPRLLTGVAVILLVALPFVLLAKFA